MIPNEFPIKKYWSTAFEGYAVPLIDKNTRIASMGSCFAVNIGRYLLEHEYNYLVYEKLIPNNDSNGLNPYLASSAHWNLVYSSACIRQIFEYSLGEFKPEIRWWYPGRGVVQDPFRRHVTYPNNERLAKFAEHVEQSRRALVDCDVLILTLGMSEVWRDCTDQSTYWKKPPKIHKLHEFYRQTVDDVWSDLAVCHKLIKKENSKVKIIITVSPVPFNLSYRKDVDVISANMVSKSVLRVAVDEFTELKDVYYFPAYEMTMFNESDQDPFVDDGRHIKPSVVQNIMEMFERRFGHA